MGFLRVLASVGAVCGTSRAADAVGGADVVVPEAGTDDIVGKCMIPVFLRPPNPSLIYKVLKTGQLTACTYPSIFDIMWFLIEK